MLPWLAAFVAFFVHLPFVIRYDLNFQPDFAVSVLMSRAIAVDGEWPIFFWGQSYQGTYGHYLTALLFRIFGFSLPLAALVSLAIWACGVGLATWLAKRLLGERAAWWTAAAAAIGSPYGNHYVTQPWLSYETVPVLALLAIAGVMWMGRLAERPLTGRVVAGWMGLGVVAGFGWWTSRLFMPAGVAAALAAALTARWQPAVLRRAAAGIALLAAGALAGASPEIVHRLRGGEAPVSQGIPLLALAPPAAIPTSLLEGLRSLPAYFNGDPRARVPEGATFAERVAADLDPAGDPHPSGIESILDWLATIVAGAVLMAALVRGVRAWRERDAPVLALCLSPFGQLALIGIGAQAAGGYYHARRYWFPSLLVLALLFANAVTLGERARLPAARYATRALAVLVLASSLFAQARMLLLPDELARFRLLAQDLVARGEATVFMPDWNVWLVSALSEGRVDGASVHYNHGPILARIAARAHMSFAGPADGGAPGALGVPGAIFAPVDEPPRRVGPWEVRRYERTSDEEE